MNCASNSGAQFFGNLTGNCCASAEYVLRCLIGNGKNLAAETRPFFGLWDCNSAEIVIKTVINWQLRQ
jgi:hypothetical protein